MLSFPVADTKALLCLLIYIFFMPQIKNVAGQKSPTTLPITLVGGYSSFQYEHGRVPPSVARANFGIVNSSSKTLMLKILRVVLATDKRTSVVEEFTASVCGERANGRTSCVNVKPNRSAIISPNSSSTLSIYFPSSQLRLGSRDRWKKIRVQCWVKGRMLYAETEIRVQRLEPWQRS